MGVRAGGDPVGASGGVRKGGEQTSASKRADQDGVERKVKERKVTTAT